MNKRKDDKSDEIDFYQNKIKKYRKMLDEVTTQNAGDNDGKLSETDNGIVYVIFLHRLLWRSGRLS